MKLQIAAIALSATLVACGGGSGGDADDTTIDGVPVIGGGDTIGEDIDLIDEENVVVDVPGASADGCEGGSGTDPDSSTASWDDNCRLQVGGEHQISSYTQGMQRVIFCRGLNNGLEITEINTFADGNFGPMTEEQVRNFQEVEGIAIDGVVGPETWGALQDVLEFLAINETGDADVYGVAPGTCANVRQFEQARDGVTAGGWTMSVTPGSPETVPFSTGAPVQFQ